MTHFHTNLLVFCAVLGISLVQAAPAASNTIMVKTINNCNIDRTMRWSGPYDSTLLATTTIAPKQSYTQYIQKDLLSLAWIFGDPSQNKFDEVEASMANGVFL